MAAVPTCFPRSAPSNREGGGRQSSAQSRLGEPELGEDDSRFPINVLTSEKLTDMGNSATFYPVLVEVELSKTSS